MTRKLTLAAIAINLFLVFTGFPYATAQEVSSKAKDEANYYGKISADQIADGDVRSGMENLRKAIQIDPYNIQWRSKLAATLERQASDVFKNKSKAEGYDLFKEAESELLIMAKLFMDNGDQANAAQIYFRVGMIYRQAYQRNAYADAYFKKTLELNPSHTQAQKALAK